jgi:hypothetical protein
MSWRLIISFWDSCLDNLPQGRFERRVITTVISPATQISIAGPLLASAAGAP